MFFSSSKKRSSNWLVSIKTHLIKSRNRSQSFSPSVLSWLCWKAVETASGLQEMNNGKVKWMNKWVRTDLGRKFHLIFFMAGQVFLEVWGGCPQEQTQPQFFQKIFALQVLLQLPPRARKSWNKQTKSIANDLLKHTPNPLINSANRWG